MHQLLLVVMDMVLLKMKMDILKIPQTGNVLIGDNVEIGANSVIDRATIGKTIIGDMTKLDNLVHIGHNVQIGNSCLITAQVGIAGSVNIKDNCKFGGQAGVAPHVEIGPESIIASKSGVTKSLIWWRNVWRFSC